MDVSPLDYGWGERFQRHTRKLAVVIPGYKASISAIALGLSPCLSILWFPIQIVGKGWISQVILQERSNPVLVIPIMNNDYHHCYYKAQDQSWTDYNHDFAY